MISAPLIAPIGAEISPTPPVMTFGAAAASAKGPAATGGAVAEESFCDHASVNPCTLAVLISVSGL